MHRKTFLVSLFSFGLLPQKAESNKEYRNGICPQCDTPASDWLREASCDSLHSREVIKPQPLPACATNEVTGSSVFQQHVCRKCKSIFAHVPMKAR